MKKIFLLSAIALCSMLATSLKAQVSPMLSTYGNAKDTVTNTGVNYVTITTTKSQNNVSVQPVITKISGTVAGTYYLQGSLDGINYVSIVGDSVTATNVTTNTKIWKESTRAYQYYRIGYTGSGTMVATLKGSCFYQNWNR